MRLLKIALIIITLVSVQVGMVACGGGGDDLTPNELTQQQLSGAKWNIGSATIDGVSTDLYAGLTLTFGATSFTYTSTNGGVVWPASGTLLFVGEDGKKVKRNDGLDITIESVTDKQLVLSYTWASTTYSGGRIGGIKGVNRLTLTR